MARLIEKRSYIASFIETLEGKGIEDNTILLGGTPGSSEKLPSIKNDGACKNDNYEECHQSANSGNCMNAACDNSTNGGDCDNSWKVGR